MEEERLVCLASCFVNVECYGCRYPNKVMEELSELTGAIQETLDEHRDMSRDVLKNFVKESKAEAVPTPANRGMGKLGIMFVKATSETLGVDSKTETDHASAEQQSNIDNAQTSRDSSADTKQSEFQTALAKFATGFSSACSSTVTRDNQDSGSCTTTVTKLTTSGGSGTLSHEHFQVGEPSSKRQKLLTKGHNTSSLHLLSEQVKSLQNLNKNAIETLHMAASKAQVNLVCAFASMPQGRFVCGLSVDGNSFTKGDASNKKAAKHNAYANAVDILSTRSTFKSAQRGQQFRGPDKQNFKSAQRGRKRSLPPSTKSMSDFIIIQSKLCDESAVENSVSILRMSADFNHMSLEYDFRDELVDASTGQSTVKCWAYVERECIGESISVTKTNAKALASAHALQSLRQTQWTIVIEQRQDTDTAGVSRDEILGDIQKQSEAIPNTNIGSKLLQKMGWSGGGVGKDGTGIAVPVSMDSVIDRQGLGLSAEQGIPCNFSSKVKTIIMDYARSNKQSDFAFSPDFSNEERAIIHKEGQKLGLKTKSYGSGDNRYLVISRKRTPAQLLEHIMRSGGKTEKYSIIPPLNSDQQI